MQYLRNRLTVLFFAAAAITVAGGCASLPQLSGDDAERAEDASADEACECATEEQDDEATADADDGAQDEALPAEPQAITSEEITFESLGDELTGVIDRPASSEGPMPAVVILHDAGPLDHRGIFEGSLGFQLPVEIAVYEQLAEHLAQHGYLVLRYDKRTCLGGGAPGCEYPRGHVEAHRESLGDALLSDARAAVNEVRGRDDVDPSRLFVVGHGQGADLALALDGPEEPSGLILLAPSPYPMDEVILHQTELSLEHLRQQRDQEGNTTRGGLLQQQIATLEQNYDTQKRQFDELRSGEADRASILGAPTATWRDFFELHEEAMAELDEPDAPILALFGEYDMEIPRDSAHAFRARLDDAPQHGVALLPKLTHILVSFDGQEQEAPRVSDEVRRAILDFLSSIDEQA